MNKLAFRMGHTKGSCGAIGILKENDITRSISPHLVKLLKNKFQIIDVQPDDNSTYPSELNYGINKANGSKADYFVSIHANSASSSANGCEILLFDMNDSNMISWANGILEEMEKLGFYNRGIKIRQDLGELRRTNMPAMIIETFFCTSQKDSNIYNKVGSHKIAEAIAKGFDVNINTKTITDIAKEVISGIHGNGQERINKITNMGYDYNVVQNEVNRLLGVSTNTTIKNIDEIARMVIRGEYGNGVERINNLKKAGYDPDLIQKRVNEMLQ